MLNYLLFLRITPFLPNWFINIVSPVIEIPAGLFFIATFLGVAPLSFIAIQVRTVEYIQTIVNSPLRAVLKVVRTRLRKIDSFPLLRKMSAQVQPLFRANVSI